MDFEELLKKYMKHVVDCEGTDFLFCTNSGGACEVEFSLEELEALEKLSDGLQE